MTIVIKELKGVKLATILAHKVCKALNIEKNNTYYFCANTIVIDQINSCRKKGISGLTRGIGNLTAKIAHEIPDGLRLFVPSDYNSAVNLIRPRITEELFAKDSSWFQPHPSFDPIGIPQFHRMQVKKILKKDDSNEENSLNELNELLAQTKATKNEIVNIMPEMRHQLDDCTCQLISQSN